MARFPPAPAPARPAPACGPASHGSTGSTLPPERAGHLAASGPRQARYDADETSTAHPRVQLHFTSTYSSRISQVERWFAELQRRCLDRGVFCSLGELTTALEEWIKIWNASARPLKWTKTADQIIDRICRYCSRISGPGH